MILHAFTGGVDGGTPTGSLLANGTSIYGTTEQGGLDHGGGGVIFKLSP